MSGDWFKKVMSVLLVLSLFALASALFRLADSRPAFAAAPATDGTPILFVQDERSPGARDPDVGIYVLWPGQRRVEAYSSNRVSFVSYDFAARTVTYSDAEIK